MILQDFLSMGFRRVAAVAPRVHIADVTANVREMLRQARSIGDAQIVVFPELSVTGYTCADLFLQPSLIADAARGLREFAALSSRSQALYFLGAPVKAGNALYNCAVAIHGGKILGIVPKQFIPNYNEFYEKRWFAPAAGLTSQSGGALTLSVSNADGSVIPFGTDLIFDYLGMKVFAEICEDLWVPAPPSCAAAMQGADVLVNLSASNEILGKHRYRSQLIAQQSARCRAAYVYASAGTGESSTDLIFPGYTAVYEDGRLIAESARFGNPPLVAKADIDIEKLHAERIRSNTFSQGNASSQTQFRLIKIEASGNLDPTRKIELLRHIERMPFVPESREHRDENCREIVDMQCHGLRQRLEAINCQKLVVGVSGGLDSTLALLLACRTFDRMGIPRSNIFAITMPGLATTSHTRHNAWQLMELLGCTCLEIPIGKAVAQHFADIEQDPHQYDAAYENSQARERTQILMDYANKCGAIVLGTGDLSESALGWCTYNGDHMSMYAINASVPKTLVKHLVEWLSAKQEDKRISHILKAIIDTPISPELVPDEKGSGEIAQKTEDLVGPYILHDFFLYHMLRLMEPPAKIFALACKVFEGEFSPRTIHKWLGNFYRRFFNQQFKRSCMPDGPKVGSVCLSPRGDWRMPSDASAARWLEEVGKLPVFHEDDLLNAVETLRKGGVILYPTDTIWGLGCDGTNPDAVARLYEIKHREEAKSMLALLPDTDSLRKWVARVPAEALELEATATVPTTIIYDMPENVAANLLAPDGSLGIRITSEPFSGALARLLGKPLVSTSANISGEAAPANFEGISGEIKNAVDYICQYRREDNSPAAPSHIYKVSNSGEITPIRVYPTKPADY